MTRSSDLVMVERGVLREIIINAISDHVVGIPDDDRCYVELDGHAYAADAVIAALQSVEGGVQVAAKQESCPESAPRTETAGAIYSALSSACIEHSALSVSGFNLFGDSKSIKAAQEWLHSHSQIGDLKTNLRHWRDECGKLHAKLTKTPSADHDAGNLRGLAEPNTRDSSESTTGGAEG